MTTTAPTIHIDETSLRFAIIRHLSGALSCLTRPEEFSRDKADIRVQVDDKVLFFSVGPVRVGYGDDLDCSATLLLWREGEEIGELSVEFADHGATIVPGGLFIKV